MKIFKKIIILSITILALVIYFIYDNFNNNVTEFIEENIFVDEGKDITQEDVIILHITGEVNIPRNC